MQLLFGSTGRSGKATRPDSTINHNQAIMTRNSAVHATCLKDEAQIFTIIAGTISMKKKLKKVLDVRI